MMGTIHALLTRGQNRGTNGSLGTPEYHYKKGERLRRRAEIFGVKELLIKILKEEKTQGILVTLLPGIL